MCNLQNLTSGFGFERIELGQIKKIMFDNKDSYTVKEYSRNKNIYKWIKIIIILGYFLVLGYYIYGIFANINTKSPVGLAFISILVFFSLKIFDSLKIQNIDDKKRNYYSWGKGAGAELVVGNKLSELGSEYKIISDFNTGRGNIDFIIVGPKGIFTIEVKANRGDISSQEHWIYVNGQKVNTDMIKQTRAEAIWLADYLKTNSFDIPIVAILEFPYGQINMNSIHGPIDGIWIGGLNFHSYVINKSLNQLSQDQINKIVEILNNFTLKQ